MYDRVPVITMRPKSSWTPTQTAAALPAHPGPQAGYQQEDVFFPREPKVYDSPGPRRPATSKFRPRGTGPLHEVRGHDTRNPDYMFPDGIDHMHVQIQKPAVLTDELAGGAYKAQGLRVQPPPAVGAGRVGYDRDVQHVRGASAIHPRTRQQ